MNIVVFSAVPWNFLWQRMQQVTSKLAARGHNVVYFEEPQYIPYLSFIQGSVKRKSHIKIDKVQDNISVVKIDLPDLQGKLSSLKDQFLISSFKQSMQKLGFHPDVSIFYSVQFVPLISVLNGMHTKINYDCADDILSFVSSAIKQGILPEFAYDKTLKMETKLIQSSSTCFATSRFLCDKILNYNSQCIYLPNAMDFNHFNAATKAVSKIDELPNLKHPVVGFVGAVFEWFDVDLICKLAEAHPEYSVLLVGPVNTGKNEFEKHSNIIMVGAKPYGVLPSYLSNIDVCLIPFKINGITLASNPIKMYEYLAAGKPVVSTALPEVIKNASEIVSIGSDYDDFIHKVKLSTKEIYLTDETAKNKRVDFARQNSWDSRVDVIERVLNESLAGSHAF